MDEKLKEQFRAELMQDILPFWTGRMTDPEGGFRGRIDGLGVPDADAPKGLILNARILWTFSAAYAATGDESLRATAERAAREVIDRFIDPVHGGAWWSLDAQGRPLGRKKQFYAIAFAIYGLAEYHRATGDGEALEKAVELFHSIETHSYDPSLGGYFEAASEDWSPISDMRLSDKDRNDAKTMNTHLHILEGYSALYRVWPDGLLGERLRALIALFLNVITGPEGHLRLFFDENWKPQDEVRSFGHDIEASWLLCEAAGVLGDDALQVLVEQASKHIAAAAAEGLMPDGSMAYELDPATGRRDEDRHWWVQAETVVGCWKQYLLTGEELWRNRSLRCWDYIKEHLLCPDGEWYWSIKDGHPNTSDDRAGFWKCPYHNGRMCIEMLSSSSL